MATHSRDDPSIVTASMSRPDSSRISLQSESHLVARSVVDEAGPSRSESDQPSISKIATVQRAHVLIVDDELFVRRSLSRGLEARGYQVSTASSGEEAVALVQTVSFDVILSDISMPNMDGIALLREIREHDNHVPVVLVTGEPTLNTAVQALEYGALHYLTKPIDLDNVERVIHRAVRMHRMSRLKEQAAKLLGTAAAIGTGRAGLEANFERALDGLWIAYQPIVRAGGAVFGYEALMRSIEPTLPHPGALLDAAERLDRLPLLGRTVRDRAAQPFIGDPTNQAALFVNLHVSDLADETLMSPASALSKIASRVVLEITERASLDEVRDVRCKIASLREMGFRIAVDDMGAGYAGLTSFALLEPEIVKLDMSLVRGVHESLTKQKVIRSMSSLCKDMGMMVVAEGVESVEERGALEALGCDLFQGFLIARPGKPFPEVVW